MAQVPHSEILLPLYIYPAAGKWDPLYAAIEQYPNLHFTVIVNPNSGPGSAPWWPNDDYIREIPRLNAYLNVRTVGYVGTTYGRKPLEEVYADIAQYAKWSSDDNCPGLGVSGIFFDETLGLYSDDDFVYQESVTRRTKETEGILGNRIVIHNPGTAVDPRFAKTGADVFTMAEMEFASFKSPWYRDWLATTEYGRDQICFMVHSTPTARIEDLVLATRERAAYIFVTDLSEGRYEDFGDHWKTFVAAMAKVSSLEARNHFGESAIQ